MAEITAQMVKELRELTNAGVMDCKKALSDADGDFEKAAELLRAKGLASAAKKSGRETNEGIIGHYIHTGAKIASLIEVNCETDFVARTEQFQQLARDLALHVVAANPLYRSREDVPEEALAEEKAKYADQVQGKPADVAEKIISGKLEKWYSEVCLLDQPYARDPERTIQEVITEHIAALGENIKIGRFARLQVGE
jgi:elongation factor Ts